MSRIRLLSWLPHVGQVANLWLTIIGGSIINQLDPFIEDPSSIVDLLGASVPSKAQVRCCVGTVMGWVGGWVRSWVGACTLWSTLL